MQEIDGLKGYQLKQTMKLNRLEKDLVLALNQSSSIFKSDVAYSCIHTFFLLLILYLVTLLSFLLFFLCYLFHSKLVFSIEYCTKISKL